MLLARKMLARKAGLDVSKVFATTLITGNGAARSIVNGLNNAGKGGLIWSKWRGGSSSGHYLIDTLRGVDKFLSSELTNPQFADTALVTSFNSDGYSLGSGGDINVSGRAYVLWNFLFAEKFCKAVTYTGNGVAGRQIAHGLGIKPGMIFTKCLSDAFVWQTYHQARGAAKYLQLNTINAEQSGTSFWNNTEPTDAVFTVGTDAGCNASGKTYVAYLVAHDTSPGGVIQCGQYVGNGNPSGPIVTLGWQPQLIMAKLATSAEDWLIVDDQRQSGGNDGLIYPNRNSAETVGANVVNFLSTGFQPATNNSIINSSGQTYIYMAIRKP